MGIALLALLPARQPGSDAVAKTNPTMLASTIDSSFSNGCIIGADTLRYSRTYHAYRLCVSLFRTRPGDVIQRMISVSNLAWANC